MNAHGQPHRSVIQGTTSGATIAPVFVPALNTPVASARSPFGNHSATVFTAPGKFADSPSPNAARAAEKPAAVRVKACAMAAGVQGTTADAKTRPPPPPRRGGGREARGGPREGGREGGETPGHDRVREAAPHADSVEPAAGRQKSERVDQTEQTHDGAGPRVRPMQVALERRSEDAEHLSVDVVHRGDGEEQRADRPAIARLHSASHRPCR